MKIITLSNEKGGVGKTTMATHIAAGFAIRGQRVLVLDTDAQANATTGMGLEEEPGFYDLLVRKASWNNVLRVIPPEIYEPPNQPASGMLAILPGNHETQTIGQKIDDAYAIKKRLMQLEGSIDIVIIDTSPTPSLLHGAIYLATDAIVYPTTCEAFSLRGLVKTTANLKNFSDMRVDAGGKAIQTLGILPTMFRPSTVEHSENLNDLHQQYPGYVWDPIKLRITWSEASMLRRPVFSIEPESAATREMWHTIDQAERMLAHV